MRTPGTLVRRCLLAVVLVAGFGARANGGSLEDMISPVSVPTLNEDPRMTTEVRPMFLRTEISDEFVTNGGDYTVLAAQARLALTDRIALIATKDGYVWWRPDEVLTDEEGFANVAFGVKGAFWKDDAHAFIATGGLRYETRWGSRDVFMGRGDGLMNPFLSVAKGLGDFHAQLYSGPRIAISGNDSSFWDVAVHFDYKLGAFYPLVEWNIVHTLDGGRRLPLAQEGFDLVDLGSRFAGGETVAALAFGLRWRICDTIDVGATAGYPISQRQDVFGWRVTTDLIWRPFGWRALFS
jgi:hypothetical protein